MLLFVSLLLRVFLGSVQRQLLKINSHHLLVEFVTMVAVHMESQLDNNYCLSQ